MKKFVIGIDVSKEKLDLCLISESTGLYKEEVVKNNIDSIKQLLKLWKKELGIDYAELLICAEYTGQYIYPLCSVCEYLNTDLWLENPTQIKYSCGFYRGKNDKIDAQKIAEYATRFRDQAKLFSLPDKKMLTLKQLLTERDLYVVNKGTYQGQLTDQKRFMDKNDYQNKSKRLKKIIKSLTKNIEEIEKEIFEIIKEDKELDNQYKLLCSIDGVGKKVAVKMIVETNGFKDFKNPRKFCCHAGVAPFEYRSGSSVHSRNKVSQRSDKSIKTLLHMASLSVATVMKGELNEYYLRKVAEGKNKMSVLNAVRAKLVHRMFAVIRNNVPFEKNYQNYLVNP